MIEQERYADFGGRAAQQRGEFVDDGGALGFVALDFQHQRFFLLGGAEYAHINRTQDFDPIGADSLELHRENIERYQESAKHRKQTEAYLKAIDAEIRKLAHRCFPKDLKKWMGLKEKFGRKKLELLDYLKRTRKLFLKIITRNAFHMTYPNIDILLIAEETKDDELLNKLETTLSNGSKVYWVSGDNSLKLPCLDVKFFNKGLRRIVRAMDMKQKDKYKGAGEIYFAPGTGSLCKKLYSWLAAKRNIAINDFTEV